MKPTYWYLIVAVGVSLSFILCCSGFWEMNYELFVNHSAYNPPPPSWYSGLTLFYVGMLPFIITVEAENRFNNEPKTAVHLKIASILKVIEISFLVMMILLGALSITSYPPNNTM